MRWEDIDLLWIPYSWWLNRKIKRLVAKYPNRYQLVGGVDGDGVLLYEYTTWWARRRELLGHDRGHGDQ